MTRRCLSLFPALILLALAAAATGAQDWYEEEPDEFGLARLVQRDGPASEREPVDATLITLITGEWVDVREILKTVAVSAGYGLQIAPDVEGLVNVHLENISIRTALRSLLEPVDLGYELVDEVLMVYKRGLITRWFSFDYPVTQRKGRGELLISGRGKGSSKSDSNSEEQNESHVTSELEMAVWPELISALQTLVFAGATELAGMSEQKTSFSYSDQDGRSLVISPMAGLIQVTAEWKRLRQAERYLALMHEGLRRQVAIEVKILEVTLSKGQRSGIDWSAVSDVGRSDVEGTLESTEGLAAPIFRFVVNGPDVTGLIEAVESQGTVQVISTPRITTLNNQKAVVRIVVEEVFYEAQVEPPVVTNGVITEPVIAYSPVIVPVGLVLDVTPQIGNDGVITLNVHPTITDIVRVESSPNLDQAPVLSVRELDTVGKVADGETLVIAGLISKGLHDTEHGVPFLRRIPILGYFFKRKVVEETQTELVMLLTPVILDAERASAWAEEAQGSIESKM